MSLPCLRSDDQAVSLEAWLARVENSMRELCSRHASGADPLLRAFDDHFASGGRRTRARLALSASRALALPETDAVALAAAVELLHNASLVQDDLQDGDESRRGRPSVWRAHGTDTAIGLTDLLISASYASLASVTKVGALPALITHVHGAVALTLRGQTEDLEVPGPGAPGDLESCLRVARNKSGPLFGLSLELPLIAAGVAPFAFRAREAACEFGLGYQIVDDLKDAYADHEAGARANTVLALCSAIGWGAAKAEAVRLARQHLASARRGTHGLPGDCGALLRLLADGLERRLPEPGDG
jgi:geranylgeranyl pyrophosphate synthase